MFHPSHSRKMLQDVDNKFADLHKTTSVRFVEVGGAKLSSQLSKADPWSGLPCGRTACLPCESATEDCDLGRCSDENVTYEMNCMTALGKESPPNILGRVGGVVTNVQLSTRWEPREKT